MHCHVVAVEAYARVLYGMFNADGVSVTGVETPESSSLTTLPSI